MMLDIAQLAAQQLRDYDARTPGTVFDEELALSEEQAYAIQSEVSRLRVERGEAVVGYKVGCTSPVIRRQLGIDHPVFGRLFDSDCWPTGTSLPFSRFSGFAIEGELAVRLASDLPVGEPDREEIADAIESVFAVIELHNLVFRRKVSTSEELIANNAIHAGFVYATGSSKTLYADKATLRIEIDEVEVAAVSGSALIHTVTESLSWLAHKLKRHGKHLRVGQIILCGSVADLIPVSHGCRIAVKTDLFGSVDCIIE